MFILKLPKLKKPCEIACAVIFLAFTIHSFSNAETLFVSKRLLLEHNFTNGIEGPACDANGNLYVVNYLKKGDIVKIFPDGRCSVFVELPAGDTGNGIRFNSNGEMLVADYTGHNILKVNMQTREVSVFAHNDLMNQPNDMAIMEDNTLFASDPSWTLRTGQLWRIDGPDNMEMVDYGMGTSNGIEVSPDETKLYVNESFQRKIWSYDIWPNKLLKNKTLFMDFSDYGLDGMRCDTAGNLYVSRYGKGVVAVISPAGELVREIPLLANNCTNLTFGGPDGRTVYATVVEYGVGHVEYFRVDIPGREWKLSRPWAGVIKPIGSTSITQNFTASMNGKNMTVDFTVSAKESIALSIYDPQGRKVGSYNLGRKKAGHNQETLKNIALPAGIYVVHLKSGIRTMKSKMLVK